MYYNICLGGGGIKLIAFIGVFKYLQDNNYIKIKSLKKLLGVSAGSIVCFLFNIGYSIDEIEEFVNEFNFEKLYPNTNTENLLFFYGFDENTKLKKLFSLFLKNKYNKYDITFKELYDITKQQLRIGVVNITTSKFEIWDYLNKPDFSIITALVISCNIPIIYKPILIDNNFYVDGGVINNFPIEYINDDELLNTISISCNSNYNNSFDNIFDYLVKIIHMISNNSTKNLAYENKLDIITIESSDNLLDFKISKENIIKKISYGYQTAKTFFNDKNLKNKKVRRYSI